MLVAPVLLEGHRSKSVYLPADDWIYVWNGSEISVASNSDRIGRFVDVEAEVGNPPVFYRKASIWSKDFAKLQKCKSKIFWIAVVDVAQCKKVVVSTQLGDASRDKTNELRMQL